MVKVIKDFITIEEERELLNNLKPSSVSRGIERNKIIRYGSPLPYKGKTELIPKWLHDLCFRVTKEWQDLPNYKGKVDHVTINEYHKGQAIDWHVDSKASGEVITVLSLESPATMGLKDKEEISFTLPERSLLHITEDDRWNKQHCIYPVSTHRWSLVFRKGT